MDALKGNTMNKAKLMVRSIFTVAFCLLFWACSRANHNAPQNNLSSGNHPAGWVQSHWGEYIKNPNQCATCHGSATVKANSGGVSGVSCFSSSFEGTGCHAGGPSHQAGWELPTLHGKAGAMAAPGNTVGFAQCAICHGLSANNSAAPGAPSCVACHVKAPHPDKPWHGTTANGTNHAGTNVGNAPVCYTCHAGGTNSTLRPSASAVVGTTPGCFNNTMCHGNSPGHVANWADFTQHGRLGAQSAPGATSGFAYCATCHGANYANAATRSCMACHTKAPHPDKPWGLNNGVASNHNVTNPGNAPECAKCHTAGANSTLKPSPLAPAGTTPGCFNNTLCHGSAVN